MRQALLISAAWILAACANAGSSAGNMILLDEADAGKSVDLRVGDTLKVALPGNPGTGYRWQAQIGNPQVLAQRGAPAFEGGAGAVGSGGTETFVFEALAQGRTRLRLVYGRSFDKETGGTRIFEVAVAVR